jgi:AbrB family looped-hinge helix DNA binding protein
MDRARVTAEGRLSLPADVRRRHGLAEGGELLVEDLGDAIVLRTVPQAIARAQAISARLTRGRAGASVDDFLADRARDSESE